MFSRGQRQIKSKTRFSNRQPTYVCFNEKCGSTSKVNGPCPRCNIDRICIGERTEVPKKNHLRDILRRLKVSKKAPTAFAIRSFLRHKRGKGHCKMWTPWTYK